MSHWYISRITDSEVSMVGPFDAEEDAADYGASNFDDDPGWNVVHMEKPEVPFVAPSLFWRRGAYPRYRRDD
jgi:hypothetical protein